MAAINMPGAYQGKDFRPPPGYDPKGFQEAYDFSSKNAWKKEVGAMMETIGKTGEPENTVNEFDISAPQMEAIPATGKQEVGPPKLRKQVPTITEKIKYKTLDPSVVATIDKLAVTAPDPQMGDAFRKAAISAMHTKMINYGLMYGYAAKQGDIVQAKDYYERAHALWPDGKQAEVEIKDGRLYEKGSNAPINPDDVMNELAAMSDPETHIKKLYELTHPSSYERAQMQRMVEASQIESERNALFERGQNIDIRGQNIQLRIAELNRMAAMATAKGESASAAAARVKENEAQLEAAWTRFGSTEESGASGVMDIAGVTKEMRQAVANDPNVVHSIARSLVNNEGADPDIAVKQAAMIVFSLSHPGKDPYKMQFGVNEAGTSLSVSFGQLGKPGLRGRRGREGVPATEPSENTPTGINITDPQLVQFLISARNRRDRVGEASDTPTTSSGIGLIDDLYFGFSGTRGGGFGINTAPLQGPSAEQFVGPQLAPAARTIGGALGEVADRASTIRPR